MTILSYDDDVSSFVAAATRCSPAAAPPRPVRIPRVRVRCCEDTLGVPRSRRPTHDTELAQSQRFPELVTPYGAASYLPHQQRYPPPPRPRRIVLVRHGESEGNVDEAAYTRVPDPRIGLTPQGWRDADIVEYGKDGGDGSEHSLPPHAGDAAWAGASARRIAGVREEPRLREQDFGNFQDRDKMRVEKEIRRRYGRFFYRFPNGESAADVYDRITGFRETLRADIDIGRFQPPGERNPDMNVVLVSHGLTLRVFLMRWYKWTVSQFEGLANLSNGGALVMQTGAGGRYSLLVHHSVDELREFGLTDDMIEDQKWQMTARPGELNYNFITNGPSFFTHFTHHHHDKHKAAIDDGTGGSATAPS
uniref:Phosphoglycerate mutase-like protein n=1 Tax=Oryza rufipogon TaxID=4529 RepID=A0A0E0PSI2_ORYRU